MAKGSKHYKRTWQKAQIHHLTPCFPTMHTYRNVSRRSVKFPVPAAPFLHLSFPSSSAPFISQITQYTLVCIHPLQSAFSLAFKIRVCWQMNNVSSTVSLLHTASFLIQLTNASISCFIPINLVSIYLFPAQISCRWYSCLHLWLIHSGK